MSHTNFKVILTRMTDHEYDIEANTSEEAISIAERWLEEEREEGTVTNSDIISWDAYEDNENDGPDGTY